jgi:hypothetical protein
MDLSPYVDQLRRELAVAAEVGGEEARALAERLTAPLESSLRLALLSALSAAAQEITGELAPGSVDVRLRGGDLGFVVTPPPPVHDDDLGDDVPACHAEPEPPAQVTPSSADADDGGTARITLRVPEQLKNRIEEAAGREGFSVNTWLTRAVNSALEPRDSTASTDRRRRRSSGQQFSGWVR